MGLIVINYCLWCIIKHPSIMMKGSQWYLGVQGNFAFSRMVGPFTTFFDHTDLPLKKTT